MHARLGSLCVLGWARYARSTWLALPNRFACAYAGSTRHRLRVSEWPLLTRVRLAYTYAIPWSPLRPVGHTHGARSAGPCRMQSAGHSERSTSPAVRPTVCYGMLNDLAFIIRVIEESRVMWRFGLTAAQRRSSESAVLSCIMLPHIRRR